LPVIASRTAADLVAAALAFAVIVAWDQIGPRLTALLGF
jgi:hypothetical protein